MAHRPMTGITMPAAATIASTTEEQAIALRSLFLRLPGVVGRTMVKRARAAFLPLLTVGIRWRARREEIASLNQLLRVDDYLLSDIGVSRLDVAAAILDVRQRSPQRSRRRQSLR